MAQRWVARMGRVLLSSHADWINAIHAEVVAVPDRRRRQWLTGVGWYVAKEVLMRPTIYLVALTGAVALVLWADRSPSDVANQATLLLILISAGLLGFAGPRQAWVTGLLIGGSISFAHAVYILLDVRLPYPTEPAGWAGPATLLILTVPALGAAYIGAFIRRKASAMQLT